MPPANIGFGRSFGIGLFFSFFQFHFIDAGAQHVPRHSLVLMLRAAVLTGHDNTGRVMGDAHGRVRGVDVLAACAR